MSPWWLGQYAFPKNKLLTRTENYHFCSIRLWLSGRSNQETKTSLLFFLTHLSPQSNHIVTRPTYFLFLLISFSAIAKETKARKSTRRQFSPFHQSTSMNSIDCSRFGQQHQSVSFHQLPQVLHPKWKKTVNREFITAIV